MRLGQRNFFVLTLEPKGAGLQGSLSHPANFNSNSGSGVTITDAAVTTTQVQSAKLTGDHLHLTFGSSNDANQIDRWDLMLMDRDHVSLGIDDPRFAIEPFMLTRVPATLHQTVATDWDLKHTYTPDEGIASSVVMAHIYEEDQRPRQTPKITPEQWVEINKADVARRGQVTALLQQGALHTSEDFSKAAFIFQHGDTPDDYLLAHTLAMVAVARGDQGAIWIASATLDRYLIAIGKPQIYGTQFHHDGSTPWTQEPYARTLISDPLRRDLNVPTQPLQEKQLELYKQQTTP